jgi:hypothetical protein
MTLVELKEKAIGLGLTPDDVRQHGSLSKKATWEAAIDAIGRQSVETVPGDDFVQNQEAIANIETTQPKPTDSAVTVTQSSRPGGWWHKTKKTFTTEDGVEIDLVDPDNLPTLAETDEQFKHWEPWMLPGATFAGNTQNFTILYFDPFGKCRVKGTDGNCLTYHIDTLVDRPVISSTSDPIPPIQPDETIDMEGWHRWDEKLKVWIQEDPNETLKDCYQPESDSLRDQLLKRMQPYVGDCIRLEDFEQLQSEPLDEPTAAIYIGWLEGSEQLLAGVTA